MTDAGSKLPEISEPSKWEFPANDKVGVLARRGVGWSAGLIVGRQLISTANTIVLARILAPGDFGLIGMATTLTALLAVCSELGLSTATVQRRSLRQRDVHNLFWINTAIGILGALVCVISARPLSVFYHEPALALVVVALGATFVLSGVAVQPTALMTKKMNFKAIALVELSAITLGSGLGVALALSGWDYWALVAQSIVAQVVRTLLCFVVSGYRPGTPDISPETKSLVSFGGMLTLTGLLIFLARNLDNVLIGRQWGSEELGYYSRAYFLMGLPSILATSSLASVMVPALSALQDDHARFGVAYRRAVRLTAIVACPIAAGMGLLARDVVVLVYGENWLPVVPIFQWLAISAVFQPIFNTQGWLFTAAGKAKQYFLTTVYYTVVTVMSFALGIHDGATGVARAYALAFVLLVTCPVLILAHRAASIPFKPTAGAVLPVLAATSIMVTVIVLVRSVLNTNFMTGVESLLFTGAVGSFTYAVAGGLLFPEERNQVQEKVRLLQRKWRLSISH